MVLACRHRRDSQASNNVDPCLHNSSLDCPEWSRRRLHFHRSLHQTAEEWQQKHHVKSPQHPYCHLPHLKPSLHQPQTCITASIEWFSLCFRIYTANLCSMPKKTSQVTLCLFVCLFSVPNDGTIEQYTSQRPPTTVLPPTSEYLDPCQGCSSWGSSTPQAVSLQSNRHTNLSLWHPAQALPALPPAPARAFSGRNFPTTATTSHISHLNLILPFTSHTTWKIERGVCVPPTKGDRTCTQDTERATESEARTPGTTIAL